MIIDCHGHHTTTPPAHDAFRAAQLAALAGEGPSPARPAIADDEIRELIETNQVALMDERGIDLTILSPKASAMEHHRSDPGIAQDWARACNDLVERVTALFPGRFAGVAQLPQVPEGDLAPVVAELRRSVTELGFVGCNLNPDASGGRWSGPAMTDEYWFPLYEAMVELDVPAMIHVSASCLPAVQTLGAHYLNGDTVVFMQLVQGDLFERFPGLRLVIPHGGGAVPYHWGRFRGLAERLGRPDPVDAVLPNVWFDTCVYHAPGLRLLFETIPAERILFATEMLGAIPRIIDPETGHQRDDTKAMLDAMGLEAPVAARVYEQNALAVYPRLRASISGAQPTGSRTRGT